MLKFEYIRDGYNQIIGSKIGGLAGGVTVACDPRGKILGLSSDLFRVTRNRDGRVVSQNTADVSLLFHE